MKNCFILFSVTAATAISLSAGAVSHAVTVTLVVRSDLRTGRLVRSVARAAPLKPDTSAPQIELPPAAAESGATAYVNKERLASDTIRRLWEERDSGTFATS